MTRQVFPLGTPSENPLTIESDRRCSVEGSTEEGREWTLFKDTGTKGFILFFLFQGSN